MNQDILTLIIVISAASYALYLIVKQAVSLFRRKSRNLFCAGCTGCAVHNPKSLLKPEMLNTKHAG
jgi:hypothetical protein